jgi:membrane protease YdiL (CAAX protease family)
MSPPGSESPRPLAPPLALVVTALGVGAMLGGPLQAQRLGLGLGLRSQVALGTVLLALPALAALVARPAAGRAAVGTGTVAPRTTALAVILGAALWVGSIGLMEIQSLVFPPSAETLDLFRRLHAALAPSGVLDALVSLTVIALLPALCEELVMRGILLPSLAVPLGAAPAILLTAAVFAVIHLDPIRLLFTFVVGFLLGLLRLRMRSLWPPVVVHSTLNALTFAIAPLVDDPTQPYTPQPALGLLCLGTGALVAWPLLRALRPSVDSPGGAT